jgi:hypothetical protein
MPFYEVLTRLSSGRKYLPGELYECSPEEAAVLQGLKPPVLGAEISAPSTGGESTGGESTGGESTGGESTGGESTGGESTGGESQVNINTAALEDLLELPNIGPALANRIIDNRPHVAIDDSLRSGLNLTDAKWAELSPLITVD